MLLLLEISSAQLDPFAPLAPEELAVSPGVDLDALEPCDMVCAWGADVGATERLASRPDCLRPFLEAELTTNSLGMLAAMECIALMCPNNALSSYSLRSRARNWSLKFKSRLAATCVCKNGAPDHIQAIGTIALVGTLLDNAARMISMSMKWGEFDEISKERNHVSPKKETAEISKQKQKKNQETVITSL